MMKILPEYLMAMQHSLKLGGTNYNIKWTKVLGIAPYAKALFFSVQLSYNICVI